MWDYICKSYVVKKSNERVEEEARVALGQGQHVTFNVRIQRKGHVVRYYAGGSSDRKHTHKHSYGTILVR
jgi:hypothetical protein